MYFFRTEGVAGGANMPPFLKSHLGPFWGELVNTPQNIYKIVDYMQKIGSETAKWQPFSKICWMEDDISTIF